MIHGPFFTLQIHRWCSLGLDETFCAETARAAVRHRAALFQAPPVWCVRTLHLLSMTRELILSNVRSCRFLQVDYYISTSSRLPPGSKRKERFRLSLGSPADFSGMYRFKQICRHHAAMTLHYTNLSLARGVLTRIFFAAFGRAQQSSVRLSSCENLAVPAPTRPAKNLRCASKPSRLMRVSVSWRPLCTGQGKY